MPGSRRLLLSRCVEWFALLLTPIVTAIKAAGPPDQPLNALEMIQRDVIHWYVPIMAVLSAIAIAGKVGQWLFGSESKVRMKAVLDGLDEASFQDLPEGDRYYNRLTIFKANRRRTWLKPFCRAGEQYQRGIQPFRIHDSSQAQNEGVSGQAWFRGVTVAVPDLGEAPDAQEAWASKDPTCLAYAQAGFLGPEKAARLRVKSRNILATPIRDFRGSKWGVLVIDSRNPRILDDQVKHLTESTAQVLGKML